MVRELGFRFFPQRTIIYFHLKVLVYKLRTIHCRQNEKKDKSNYLRKFFNTPIFLSKLQPWSYASNLRALSSNQPIAVQHYISRYWFLGSRFSIHLAGDKRNVKSSSALLLSPNPLVVIMNTKQVSAKYQSDLSI